MILYERIERILKHRGWKPGRLAAIANMDRGQMTLMRKEFRTPRVGTLQKIARALDVTVDYLVDGEDEDRPIVELVTSQSLKAFLRENRIGDEDRRRLESLIGLNTTPVTVQGWIGLVSTLQHLGHFEFENK